MVSRATDVEHFKAEIANKAGWQFERMRNLNAFLANAPMEGEENLVADAWTELPSYCALIGSPSWGIIEPTLEKIGEHVNRLLALDLPIAERQRVRVDEIVKDPETAGNLKAWYPTWCKRPTFSDFYLQAFNEPHVHLVDTDGKGVSSATVSGLVVGDREYPSTLLFLLRAIRRPLMALEAPRYGLVLRSSAARVSPLMRSGGTTAPRPYTALLLMDFPTSSSPVHLRAAGRPISS